MSLRRAAVASLGLCLAAWGSQAQTTDAAPGSVGPYVRIESGWNGSIGTSFAGSGSGLAADATWKDGYLVGGAFGMGMGQYRVEMNIDYRDNVVDNFHVGNAGAITPFPAGTPSGALRGLTEMLNGYMDLPDYSWMGITPYIGAGVGIATVRYDGLSAGNVYVISNSALMPALQAMVGAHYNLSDSWQLELEYRFLNGFNPNFTDNAGQRVSASDYRNNSVLLGLTYSFGAAPPPPPAAVATPAAAAPPPAAAPGPRQLFIVFFDFDKSTLTAAGKQVLDEAAAAFNANNPVRIEVTGYTDTVGTQGYNLALSERRADAVRDYLKGKGVPAERQNVAWKGKTDLRVQTPDGVREPQNRRAEIIFP